MIHGIIDAVSDLIHSEYPEYPVYLDDWQEGCDRPSFCMAFVQETQTPKNKTCYARNIIIHVVFFAPLNPNGKPDKSSQYAVYEKLRKIFSAGFFAVADRKVKIRQLTGGARGNEIYLGLNLDLTGVTEDTTNSADIAASLDIHFDL